MNKRGQFYLIAAIIIITIIAGFAFISNYSSKKIQPISYSPKDEITVESQKVLDYGIANGKNLNDLLNNFSRDYSIYSDSDSLYFVLGVQNNIIVSGYNKAGSSSIIANFGNGSKVLNFSEAQYLTKNFSSTGQSAILTINGIEYGFTLKPTQNYYFVVSKDIEGERYVSTSGYSSSQSVGGQQVLCGNSITDSGEQCDDGNTKNEDGCSSVCAIEPGYSCSGQPSVCILIKLKSNSCNKGWCYWNANTADKVCALNGFTQSVNITQGGSGGFVCRWSPSASNWSCDNTCTSSCEGLTLTGVQCV